MEEILRKHYSLKTNQVAAAGVTQNGKRTVIGITDNGVIHDIGDAVFEIGSVTKVFTTTLFAHFVSLGKAGLHDQLHNYIPAMKDKNITLYQLATHTSGLPRDANNMKMKWKDRHNPFKNFQLQDAYYFIENYTSKKQPPFNPSYSNIGMAMLGNVLSSIEGMSYEDLLKKYIFEPFNMHNSFIAFEDKKDIKEIKSPLGKKGFYPRFELYGDAPSGAVKSTLNDLLSFLEANMGVLDNNLLEAMQSTHQDQGLKPLNKDVSMGIGWMKADYTGQKININTHGGTTPGFNTHIGFTEDHKTGVVVFDNIHLGLFDILSMAVKKEYTKVEKAAESLYEELLIK
jgi:CubicO group peptidase (beta-lactamase class C family)